MHLFSVINPNTEEMMACYIYVCSEDFKAKKILKYLFKSIEEQLRYSVWAL